VLLLGERGFNTKGACQAGEVPLLVINELKPINRITFNKEQTRLTLPQKPSKD